MIIYFADRYMNILGMASTELPEGLTITDDLKTEDIETGVASLELTIPFDADTRAKAESCAAVGNYILKKGADGDEFYTIIESEVDTGRHDVQIYAEDAGLDLINEVVGEYAADKAYPISHYVNKYVNDSGFVIGINEVSTLTRKLSWEGEATATERLASVATQFDGCEISYTFEIEGLEVKKKYVNIHKQRGKDVGIQLRLNKEVDRIITKKSIANLATALQCTGGTPDEEDAIPITLKGYSYDDGDFYVDSNGILRSRTAVQTWGRLVGNSMSHIIKQYSYDTTSQQTLCAHAITELKKIRDMELNFEVEVNEWPDNVSIGDRVNIIDDAGELYLSTRLLQFETSEVNQTKTATLGEHLLKTSGISQKVIELAANFAKMTVSVQQAQKIANAAKTAANAAQTQAEEAFEESEKAQKVADDATAAANTATQSAAAATEKANEARAAVDVVEESVSSLEVTVTNAQNAAAQAQQAAETADAKAEEAKTAAQNAQTDADEAKEAAGTAQTAADSAVEKANTAQQTADTAQGTAAEASQVATDAKAGAEQANEDIAALGRTLETVQTTMQTDYARKTELTETEASLQSQISQNSAQIQLNVSKLQTVDETANNAAALAAQAQSEAQTAQKQADDATADAEAAQKAAGDAAAAAASAQSEADTAKAAAATAQGVADKAEEDLAAAKADLATVTSRVDSTEEEIEEAQAKVNAAQTAADAAKADAATAASKAAQAQSTADTAVTNASNAQKAADDAADKADIAQQAADEAKGNAAAAQATADEAKTAAATAQETANTAKTNATNAQAAADQAAADAAAAQQAADDADAKAAQAASDLATAQQNLVDVTNRVDATEEEVEAAQAAVVTAQAAADKAKQDAAAAQSTANTAKANAATAQTAADNAKTAADEAQEAADEAQEAADKAQADVDALAVRVTKAETDIVQTSEEIKLYAKKTEVAQTLGGYYTKDETDAAISVKSDEITSTVERKFSGLQIGGRNLFRNTMTFDGWPVASNITAQDGVITFAAVSTLAWNAITNRDAPVKYSDIRNKEVTVSFEVRCDEYEALNSQPSNGLIVNLALFKQGAGARYAWVDANYFKHVLSDKWERIEYTFTASDSFFSIGSEVTTFDTDNFVIGFYNYSLYSMQIRNVKLERGNKATDWSPAPEDMATASDLDNYATKSEVTQTADSITASVSTTYATKSALATTDTKAANAATAASNAQSTADTAKTNAATAQSTANAAKTNADTAQTTANEAKKIANEGAKKINTHMRSFTKALWQKYGAAGWNENWTTGGNYDNTHINVGDVAYIVGTVTDAGGTNDVSAVIYGNVTAVTTSAVTMTSLYYIMGGEGGAYALANTANNTANTANSTANTAKTNAATAQSKAESAASAASAAQTAADNAQDDVDALETRVTTAETAIEQNATSITLRATKTEVQAAQSTANNAASAAAAAQSSADAAQATIDGMEVGGRNLVAGTDNTTVYSGNKGSSTYKDVWAAKTIVAPEGTEYVVSFDAKADVAQTMSCFFYSPNTTLTSESSTGAVRTDVADGSITVNITTEWKRYWVKWTQTAASAAKSVIVGRCSTTDNIYIRAVKLESGNVATDWTPAPEDVEGDINTAQSTANTAKTNAATAQSTADTAKANAAAAQSTANTANNTANTANSTANTAKTNAATAQSTANSAANAASAAQTTANTANSTANAAKSAAAAAQSDIDNLEVGSRNLLLNTSKSSTDAVKANGATQTTSGIATWNNTDGVLSLDCSTSSAECYYRFMSPSMSNLYGLEVGSDYTISGKMKAATTSGTLTQICVRSQNGVSNSWTGGINQAVLTADSDEWVSFEITHTIPSNATGVYFSVQAYFSSSWVGTLQLTELKLEKGNRATGWTPAPEDVQTSLDANASAAYEAQQKANSAYTNAEIAIGDVEELKNIISMLVTDANGTSQMVQTSNGWTFNISGILNDLENTAKDVAELDESTGADIDDLKADIKALQSLDAWVRISTTSSGEPCLAMGQKNSDFKIEITNTEIAFYNGSVKMAWLTNQEMYITKAVVDDEFRVGGLVMKEHGTNGNVGFMWKG